MSQRTDGTEQSQGLILGRLNSSGQIQTQMRDTNGNLDGVTTSNSYGDDVWHMAAYGRSGSTQFVQADGGSDRTEGSVTTGDIVDTGILTHMAAYVQDSGSTLNDPLTGELAAAMVFDRALSQSELSSYYAAATSNAFITGATKSFGATSTPDLTNLDYTLNGHSIAVDVIGSPGTASEEIVSQTLDGATSYSLTWSNSHTDFRVTIKPSTSNLSQTPTLNRVSLA